MTASNQPASGKPDDPWEQLAEDLFGLDYGKEHAAVESADRAPPEEPPPPAIEPREQPGIVPEAAAEPAFAPSEAPEPQAEPLSAGPVAEVQTEPARPPAASPQDSYWDALANWNWDEGDRPAEKAKPSQPEGGERPRGSSSRGGSETRSAPPGSQAERSGSPPRQPAAEGRAAASAEESGDFGLGVDSDGAESSFEEIPADVAGSLENQTEDEDDGSDEEVPATEAGAEEPGDRPRKRRRRRRRRRSRDGDEAPRAQRGPASGGGPPVEWDDLDESPPKRHEEPPPRPAEHSAPPRRSEREGDRGRPEPRGRRDRRDAPAPSAPSAASARPDDEFDDDFGVLAPVDEVIESGGGVGAEFDSDDDGGDSGDSAVNYADVPTWEEAISYLLHPNQVQVESGSRSGAPRGPAQSGDQPRQTRHYGGRKGR